MVERSDVDMFGVTVAPFRNVARGGTLCERQGFTIQYDVAV